MKAISVKTCDYQTEIFDFTENFSLFAALYFSQTNCTENGSKAIRIAEIKKIVAPFRVKESKDLLFREHS